MQSIDPMLPPKAGTKYYYEYLDKNEDKQNGNAPTNHDQWESAEGKSDAEKQLISNQIDYIVKQTATQVIKNRGTIPQELQEYVGSLFKVNPQYLIGKHILEECLDLLLIPLWKNHIGNYLKDLKD